MPVVKRLRVGDWLQSKRDRMVVVQTIRVDRLGVTVRDMSGHEFGGTIGQFREGFKLVEKVNDAA